MPVTLRTPRPDDAEALRALVADNRDFFRTGEPRRPEEFYTLAGQTEVIRSSAAASEAGTARMFLIEDDGEVVGRANLNSIIRGALQSAAVGYVVAREHTGRGVATAALRLLVRHAFDDLGLHRLQGETLVDNAASQGVLRACGFERYGTAPDYLRIDGRWRTCALFQLLDPAWEE